MKICPRCQRTYPDDNLNFCLDDGSVLTQAGPATPPETVLMNQPRMTDPNTGQPSQPGMQAGWNTAPQQYSVQPKKSSKTWLWVLGILALVGLLCGGGIIGFFAYVASKVDSNTVSNTSTNTNKKTIAVSNSPSRLNTSTSPTPKPDDSATIESIDLSQWVKDFSVYGTTEMRGDELVMGSKEKGYYYVLVASDDYTTAGASTKVTLRNIDNANSSLGYGLIFHSNPSPLIQDYAFIIDTKKLKYRVARHQPGKETDVIKWTSSDAIKDGSQENVLEVKDLPDKIELYINGSMVTSIKNTFGYANGVPGLYSGDAVKIGFKDLEIRK